MIKWCGWGMIEFGYILNVHRFVLINKCETIFMPNFVSYNLTWKRFYLEGQKRKKENKGHLCWIIQTVPSPFVFMSSSLLTDEEANHLLLFSS